MKMRDLLGYSAVVNSNDTTRRYISEGPHLLTKFRYGKLVTVLSLNKLKSKSFISV